MQFILRETRSNSGGGVFGGFGFGLGFFLFFLFSDYGNSCHTTC